VPELSRWKVHQAVQEKEEAKREAQKEEGIGQFPITP
jgi:hypothetical protein